MRNEIVKQTRGVFEVCIHQITIELTNVHDSKLPPDYQKGTMNPT